MKNSSINWKPIYHFFGAVSLLCFGAMLGSTDAGLLSYTAYITTMAMMATMVLNINKS